MVDSSIDLGFVGLGFESRSCFYGGGGVGRVCFFKLGFVWGVEVLRRFLRRLFFIKVIFFIFFFFGFEVEVY